MSKKLGTLVAVGVAAGLLLLGSGKKGSGAVLPGSQGRPGLPPGSRVLLVGDSFAVGLKGPLGALAAQSGVPFEGHGAEGTIISQWAKSSSVNVPGRGPVRLDLEGYLASFRPTHVLIVLGTNDEKVDPGFVPTDIAAIGTLLQKIRAAGATPLWVGPPSLPFPRQGISQAAQRAVERYLPSEIFNIPRAADGLHPKDYGPWANLVWQWALSGHRYEAAPR